MIPLKNVNINQIKKVLSNKTWKRGCGKTIAAMFTLLSYIKKQNAGKSYLFIGENSNHVNDISWWFYSWIIDIDAECDYSSSLLKHKVTIPEPPPSTKFLKEYFTLFGEPSIPPILFNFESATSIRSNKLRGIYYNKIIIDLTSKTYKHNIENITEILTLEKYGYKK